MQQTPDIAALLKIAQSPAGQKLLTMLKTDHASQLDSITSAAASGDLEAVKQRISGLLASQEARELLKQLEQQL